MNGLTLNWRMSHESQPILNYATPAAVKPRRLWLPAILLLLAFIVWNWPRLTPTRFPNRLDLLMLVLLAPQAFVMARYSSIPGWAFTAFGACGVVLFLLANFNDNNFAANTDGREILLPWCAIVVGGALASRVVAFFGRSWISH